MKRLAIVGFLINAVVLLGAAPPAIPLAASDGPARPIRWLAAGDSFSAGEGIPFGETPCQRHRDAYAPRAYRALAAEGFPVDSDGFQFVACTGAITDQFSDGDDSQLEETGGPFDLVTLTFGGNNIGFADVLKDCAGLDGAWNNIKGLLSLSWHECGVAPETLFDRIDTLVGSSDAEPYKGSVNLPALYDQVAEQVNPGGHVVVLGYPQVIEDPAGWGLLEGLRCNRIKRFDARTLRTVGDVLNTEIMAAVVKADRRHPEVTFSFLDVRDIFEGHGLCNGVIGQEWIVRHVQALQHPRRLERMFHPNPAGHAAMADALVTKVKQLEWQALMEQPREEWDGRAVWDWTQSPDVFGCPKDDEAIEECIAEVMSAAGASPQATKFYRTTQWILGEFNEYGTVDTGFAYYGGPAWPNHRGPLLFLNGDPDIINVDDLMIEGWEDDPRYRTVMQGLRDRGEESFNTSLDFSEFESTEQLAGGQRFVVQVPVAEAHYRAAHPLFYVRFEVVFDESGRLQKESLLDPGSVDALIVSPEGISGFVGYWVEVEGLGYFPNGVIIEAEGDHYLWIDDGTFVARIEDETILTIDLGFGVVATAVLSDGEMVVRLLGEEVRFRPG